MNRTIQRDGDVCVCVKYDRYQIRTRTLDTDENLIDNADDGSRG